MQGQVATLLRGSSWGLGIPEQPTRQGCGGRAQFSDHKLWAVGLPTQVAMLGYKLLLL